MTFIQSKSDDLELTILMPCLNESETIAICINKALNFLQRSGIKGEVLIADNGSTDGSQKISSSLGVRVIHVLEKGYGAALIGGINEARGKFVIMGDCDDSYNFLDLDMFIKELREGADLVIGNRFKGGISPGSMPFLHKYLGNPVLSFIGRLFFKIPVSDFHCGLRGFKTLSFRTLALKTTGMEFASEMIVRSALAEYKIVEVPTTLCKAGRSRPPHLRTWRDGWRHLKFLLMYSPRWLFLYPGFFCLFMGAVIISLLFNSPFILANSVMLDINTFTGACFLIIFGVQLIIFALISRFYAGKVGLLHSETESMKFLEKFTTDTGAVWSFILFLFGFSIFFHQFYLWSKTGFGPLTDPLTPRLVILGLTFVVISLQALFASFFLGILKIPLK